MIDEKRFDELEKRVDYCVKMLEHLVSCAPAAGAQKANAENVRKLLTGILSNPALKGNPAGDMLKGFVDRLGED